MESLLLGALSYYGNSNPNKIKENPNKENTKNNYNTNLENNMNVIEKNQADTLKNTPDFFKQFDSLTFDNLSKPTPENQSYMTRSGFNKFLQRDLDFQNGYSEFQNSDMHYGVTAKENFVHNNMTPFTSKRDTLINLDSNTRKYENLTGNNSLWRHKEELETFFEPVKDMTNVYGLPAVSGELSSRYNASFKNNNGNLPFQSDIKVMPGLDNKKSVPYPVHRIKPRNIDELRSESNRKISYLNKPLQVIKKGDMRAVESEITKFKNPSYREITTDDLVGNKYNVEGPREVGNFVHIDTARGTNDINYKGGAHDSKQGNSLDPESIYFSDAKRENYLNDFTHAINAVNTRPVFNNKDSWTNYETDREIISQEIHASGAFNTNQSNYHIDRSNIAKTTIKENTIIQDRNLGINGVLEKKTYMLSNDLLLQTTNRETTNYNNVGNPAPIFKKSNLLLNDEARQTIRETTNYNDVANSAPTYKNNNLLLNDEARQTIRETTNYNDIGNSAPTHKNTHIMLSDQAKDTNKQTTVENCLVLNPAPTFKNIYSNLTENAKPTIKQSTVDSTFILNSTPSYQNVHTTIQDGARPTIKESTVQHSVILNAAPTFQNTHTNLPDKAKPTIKESTVISSIIGNSAPTVVGSIIQNNDIARKTVRETTSALFYGTTQYQGASNYVNNEDNARDTIRQTTEINEYVGIIGGDKETYTSLEDEARSTIRETTLTETPVQNIVANVTQAYTKNDEEARSTIKETLLHEAPGGRMFNNNQSNYTSIDDARPTVKQTTILQNYKGIATYNVDASRVEDAERNMTIRDKRQQTALGARPANRKSDKLRGNINVDTVKFQNKKTLLTGYVSIPGTSSNYSVTPFEKTSTNKKTDLNSNNFYRIDPLFIETLDKNPLVNDLRHQKNTDFNSGL
jgi:hypothetical protein